MELAEYIKGELKEELKKELVTREIFEERFKRMELWFTLFPFIKTTKIRRRVLLFR